MPPWKRMSFFSRNALGAQELAVEAAERRAAIAGDEARGIEAVAAVEFLLHQAEPHQRLEAGHEDPALAEVVFIVELDVAQRHQERLLPASLPSRDPILPEGWGLQRHMGLRASRTMRPADG